MLFAAQGEALADIVEANIARAVGVSNFNTQEMVELHDALQVGGGLCSGGGG